MTPQPIEARREPRRATSGHRLVRRFAPAAVLALALTGGVAAESHAATTPPASTAASAPAVAAPQTTAAQEITAVKAARLGYNDTYRTWITWPDWHDTGIVTEGAWRWSIDKYGRHVFHPPGSPEARCGVVSHAGGAEGVMWTSIGLYGRNGLISKRYPSQIIPTGDSRVDPCPSSGWLLASACSTTFFSFGLASSSDPLHNVASTRVYCYRPPGA